MNLCSLLAFRLGPITSLSYIVNGQDDNMLNRETSGALILSLCT